jgi:lysophospholipase L1-like esterase
MKPLFFLRAIAFVSVITSALAQAPNFNHSAAATSPLKGLPSLFLIGDSTVNTPTKGQQGWGTPIAKLFDTNKITVFNKARGGRSSRTYLTEGLWEEVRKQLKPGDFVLMQFGHNDGGPLADGRARASLKGNGDETQEIENKISGKKEVVHTYGWYLRQYIRDAKDAGATPIVLSLVPRNIWVQGKVIRAGSDYGKWAAEAAHAEDALFIDLNSIIAAHYEAAGKEKVQELYFTSTDHTHTTPVGAELNAASVVEGIRALKNCPLKDYLARPAGDAVQR